jgi:hypothetical protein
MFKHSISLTFAAVALVVGSQAYAGNFSGPGAGTISPAPGAPLTCATLSNDITVQLSANVHAGYTCVGSFVAAACSSAGTNKQQTIPCTYTAISELNDPLDPSAGSTVTGYSKSDASCADVAVGDPGAGAASTATFQGRVAYRGAGGGGTVGAVNLRGTVCNGAAAESLTTGT